MHFHALSITDAIFFTRQVVNELVVVSICLLKPIGNSFHFNQRYIDIVREFRLACN